MMSDIIPDMISLPVQEIPELHGILTNYYEHNLGLDEPSFQRQTNFNNSIASVTKL